LGFDRLRALMLLAECTGDDIWSLEHCRIRGVPQSWMDELQDCFESGFQQDSQTIYVGRRLTNQYQGVRDVDLAMRLGEYLGIDVPRLQASAATRADLVRRIREAVEED
jgi:hypothetical protein